MKEIADQLLVALLGGLVASAVTAFVSIHILHSQFRRDEKITREGRVAEIMQKIEGAVWTIFNSFIHRCSLREMQEDEFYRLPTGDIRGEWMIKISEEKMKIDQLVYQAERELAQQRALIQLFIVNSQIPKIKEALGSIQTKDRKVCSVRPEEATNWCEYCEALSKLRCVMQEYARV